MIKVIKFDVDYGYIKQALPNLITINLNNLMELEIEEEQLEGGEYALTQTEMSNGLIGIIENEELVYYIHIKNNVVYVTPYINNTTEGSLKLKIEKFHGRFKVNITQYSYVITDTYTEQTLELGSDLFLKGRKPFILNAENTIGDPVIYLKIAYENYITFLEYTNSKSDFALKTVIINFLIPSSLKLDFISANELVIRYDNSKQIIRLNDLKRLKDVKLSKEFRPAVKEAIYLKINDKLYVINEHNKKLSIKTDKEKALLFKNSDVIAKKNQDYIELKGEIHYNTTIRPDALVTKEGVFLTKLYWSGTSFSANLRIDMLQRLENIHNTIFVAINNKKLHPLHQSPKFKDKKHVLLSFNVNQHAIILRRNASNNLSIGNLPELKIYNTSHKLKIKFAEKIAKLYKALNKKHNVNVYFEKEASKAVESGKYVFEAVVKQKFDSKNVFILDKTSKQYAEMKRKWGNKIVERFSFKNYLYVFIADHFISSELSNHIINTRIFNDALNEKIKITPLYFLQHGITFMKPRDDPKDVGFHKNNMTNNIVKSVVSSEVEARIFNTLGYNDFDIMKTGMPKFDEASLKKNANKITYMPTWRPWEEGEVFNGKITQTSYYQSLIDVIKAFEKAGMLDRLQIAAHNKFSQFAKSHLKKYQNIFVEDPTDTLTNSAIYITDISSIILDATYQGAYPIFYWKEFDSIIEHYGGTTPVNKYNAPGTIVYSENELVNTVKDIIAKDYKMPEKVKENYKKINEFEDNKNTQRVINELIKDNVL